MTQLGTVAATETKPDTTADCCEAWAAIAPHFRWFVFNDWKDLAAMPHIRDDAGNPWRVNHCPVCGATQRDAIRPTTEVIQ